MSIGETLLPQSPLAAAPSSHGTAEPRRDARMPCAAGALTVIIQTTCVDAATAKARHSPLNRMFARDAAKPNWN